ncbi:MAG: IS110 family transposase [Candidatus Hydrothermarchaeota archaeon]
MSNGNSDVLIVSLDIHKKVHYAHCELKSSAKIIGKDFSFPNSCQGFATFFNEVQERLHQFSIPHMAVVLEPTGPYWKPLGYAVIHKGWPLYIVSTEQVFHQRIADDPAASKLDELDPKTIAKLFRDGKATPARLPQGVFRELQKLHREYLDLTKKLAREKIQIKSLLAEVNPEFTSFFSNLFGKIALAILSVAPTPAEIVNLGIENLTSVFKKYGNGIIGRRKAEKLIQLMRSSIAVPNKSAISSLNRTLQRVTLYRTQIQQVTDSLINLASPWVSLLTTIEGIATKAAARFMAELGDPNSIRSPKALVKLTGIASKEFKSGSSVHKKPKISKKGNPFLRTIAYYMAISCIKRNPRLAAYYQHLLSKGKPKMVAVCAVIRKLLLVIYHVLHNEPYQPEKIGIGVNNHNSGSDGRKTPTPPSG